MMIRHLSWNQDITEEYSVTHVKESPSLDEIFDHILQLDGYEYTSVGLSLDVNGVKYPKLHIRGDKSSYSIHLSPSNMHGGWNNESYSYINSAISSSLTGYRALGKTYPGLEIETQFLTADIKTVVTVVTHFAVTGQWKPSVPFIIERNDDDSLVREYHHVDGELQYDIPPNSNKEIDDDEYSDDSYSQ